MASTMSNNDISVLFGGKTPEEYIYQDEQCVVFEADNKQAPVHFLVVPRKVIPRLCAATEDDEKLLGHLLMVSCRMAKELGLARVEAGFRVVINEGPDAGQTLDHLYVHVFGGRQMHWPFS